jgi:hypothetical protein
MASFLQIYVTKKIYQKIDKPEPCTPEPLLLAGGVKSQFLKSS